MGQLRLLLGCYAVTFGALAAGAHKSEIIGPGVLGGCGQAEAEGRGQRGSIGEGNAGEAHWRGPRGGLKRELERKREVRIKSQTESLFQRPRSPDLSATAVFRT